MTFASLFNDMTLLFIFLLIGCVIHETIKITQKLYLPASIIGGALALICSQQALNLITIPKSFSKYSITLLMVVIASSLLGIRFTTEKVKSYADTALMLITNYGVQIVSGICLAEVLTKIWPGLPLGWGAMGVFSFLGRPWHSQCCRRRFYLSGYYRQS